MYFTSNPPPKPPPTFPTRLLPKSTARQPSIGLRTPPPSPPLSPAYRYAFTDAERRPPSIYDMTDILRNRIYNHTTDLQPPLLRHFSSNSSCESFAFESTPDLSLRDPRPPLPPVDAPTFPTLKRTQSNTSRRDSSQFAPVSNSTRVPAISAQNIQLAPVPSSRLSPFRNGSTPRAAVANYFNLDFSFLDESPTVSHPLDDLSFLDESPPESPHSRFEFSQNPEPRQSPYGLEAKSPRRPTSVKSGHSGKSARVSKTPFLMEAFMGPSVGWDSRTPSESSFIAPLPQVLS